MTVNEQIKEELTNWINHAYPHVAIECFGGDDHFTLILADPDGKILAGIGIRAHNTLSAKDVRSVRLIERARGEAAVCNNPQLQTMMARWDAKIRSQPSPPFTGFLPLSDSNSIETIEKFIETVLTGANQ